jgi:CubicO group peptidase (beta-lactamase class C family)
MFKRFVCCLLLAYAAVSFAAPQTDPAAAGLSSEGVAKLDAFIDTVERRGFAAGGIAVVERRGEVGYYRAFGKQSLKTGDPVTADTIFRIFSMTKPVTSVAAMILHDAGKLDIDAPVAQYIPALADLKVGMEEAPAVRQPTVKDLLMHTAGLAYGLSGSDAVTEAYKEAEMLRRDETLEDKMVRLGKLPLKHQPGTQWDYSISVDVLGSVVEVASGQPLDVFFQEQIFEPLGMVDTAFYVPQEEADRLAVVYASGLSGLKPAKVPAGYDFTSKPKFFSGGGGLVSTAEDYMRFCRMLLNRGEYNGVRILQAETVDLMTRDHLGDLPISMVGRALGMGGAGFGLGFSVTKQPFHDTRGDFGEYNWGGAASTIFWIDPKQELIGLWMVQLFPSNFTTGLQFKRLVYEALEE